MRLLFPILASVVGLLLVAGFYSGLVGRSDEFGRGVRLGSMGLAMAIHAWAFAYFWSSGRRIEAIVRRDAMPDWVGALAEKNGRRALHFQVFGSVMAVMGAGLLASEWWYPILSGASLSFQIGSFLGENLIVVQQSKLLEHLRGSAVEL
jgi:hypothetical protein